MQRRDRDAAVEDRPQVGADGRIAALAQEAEPIIVAAPRIDALVDGEKVLVAFALAGDLDALHFLGPAVGKIDVHQNARPKLHRHQAAHDMGAVTLGHGEAHAVAVDAGHLREGDRLEAESGSLHGGGDGSRIGDVVGDVLAAIDAGENEIGQARHDLARRHDNAVGGRAGHLVATLLDLAEADGVGKGKRVPGARLFLGRRHHPDIGRNGPGDRLKGLEAGGMDAIVVGDENAHQGRAMRSAPPI